jgi:ATP-dependent exoDNAse (exonuclease V) beta subunit
MNLVPLVHESLAHGQFNLIVGDPKQSIYRFKNGVAEQFVALPRIYNPEQNPSVELKSEFFDRLGQLEGLTENWRSSHEIVAFNNAFFEALKHTLPPSGVPYYNQVTQSPRGKQNGYIEFVLQPKTEESPAEVEANLLRWVESCLADGYNPSDICVLARLKSECNTYANILKNNGYQVVSADSLLVSSDQYVQLIIAYCRLRNHPDHRQLLMRFAELFLRLFSPATAFDAYQSCFETTSEGKHYFSKELFFAHSVFHQKDLSRGFQDIFSLVQSFVREYGIDELQNAYVHQLLDLAAQFDLHNGPDLAGFLSFYDNIGNRTNVQLPENRHSIKVMTAHKSKGLEFPVVILPSVRFEAGSTKKSTRIFESGGHFVQSKLSETDRVLPEVDPHVTIENEAAVMDYVNLLYVAFTRPIDRLYFMGAISSRDSLQKTIFQTLAELYPQFVNLSAGQAGGSVIKGAIGTPPAITPETEAEDLSFVPVSLNGYLWFPYISILSEEEQDELQLTRERRFGRQFHAIMEQSTSLAEAEDAIARGLLKGTVEAEFKDALKVQAEQLFANAQYASLLEGGHQLDEQTLLVDVRTRLRPDKVILHKDRTVVIDFKTGERKPEHRTQVAKYAYVLGLMGFPAIEGWLYYVGEGSLVRVNL